ncbi:MAG TPA: carboxypeptidase-like regulatory domain-containing protein [Gemmatimonadales bacterium]|nr:carboxypeptidase-like regulatory domain-containing protein [Gemmatimonadales bacterium]
MISVVQPRRGVRLVIAVLILAGSSASANAQTVVEVQAGGSSLADGYGVTGNFWRSGMDGWIGIGYLDGFRAGAFLRKATAGGDTLGVGNSALVMRLPTDIFTPGYNLLVQGLSYAGGSARTSYLLFGGASSAGVGAPSFQPTSIERPMGAIFFQHRVEPTVRLTATAVIAERQTFLPGMQWQPTPDLTAGFVTGMGSDRPYMASSLVLRRGRLGVQASYAWNPERFRRVAVPTPNQTELDRENIMITYEVGSQFSIGAGRQNFVQDSADAAPVTRAVGNTVFAGGRLRELRVTAGLYHSRSNGVTNLSSYFALGRELSRWLDAELFLLQSRPEGEPTVTTPVANLRWRISPRIGLSQQVSLNHGRPTVRFGASLMTPVGDFAADYQIVHQPLQPQSPFRSTLNLTARLQLGSYSTSIGTYIRPDGAVDYSASGSTFLYMGTFGGAQPQQIGGRMARYVVRGRVRDDQGAPIEGAAVELGGEVVYTNSTGDFFLRARHPERYAVKVLLNEFLLPGHWEVVSAPATVMAEVESRALSFTIVLRRPATAAP